MDQRSPQTRSVTGGRVLPEPQAEVRAAQLMERALAVARATAPGDVPVGAVVFGPGDVELAAASNRREADQDPTAHAEVLALRAAAQRLGRWRLEDCTLVVTLEPCTMCAGALVGARLGSLIFGAYEPKTGAVGSCFEVVRDSSVLHRTQVYAGVRAAECEVLLREFFAAQRR